MNAIRLSKAKTLPAFPSAIALKYLRTFTMTESRAAMPAMVAREVPTLIIVCRGSVNGGELS